MTQLLASPTILQSFPVGTPEQQYSFNVSGTLADGTTTFNQAFPSDASSTTVDLPAGTFTYTVSKMGFTSLPSDPFTIQGQTTVQFNVPDGSQKASPPVIQ